MKFLIRAELTRGDIGSFWSCAVALGETPQRTPGKVFLSVDHCLWATSWSHQRFSFRLQFSQLHNHPSISQCWETSLPIFPPEMTATFSGQHTQKSSLRPCYYSRISPHEAPRPGGVEIEAVPRRQPSVPCKSHIDYGTKVQRRNECIAEAGVHRQRRVSNGISYDTILDLCTCLYCIGQSFLATPQFVPRPFLHKPSAPS